MTAEQDKDDALMAAVVRWEDQAKTAIEAGRDTAPLFVHSKQARLAATEGRVALYCVPDPSMTRSIRVNSFFSIMRNKHLPPDRSAQRSPMRRFSLESSFVK